MPTDELLVLVENESEGLALEAYALTGGARTASSPNFELLWTRALGGDRYRGLVIDPNGNAWVIDRTGASAYDRYGTVTCRVTVPLPINMEVAALTFAGDDLVFACQCGHRLQVTPSRHRPAIGMRYPQWATTELGPGWMVRLSRDSEICWSRTIPNPNSDGLLPEVESWSCAQFAPGKLFSADDCVFAVYRDFRGHWPAFGVGHIVSIHDGALRYTTDLSPIDDVAVAEGAFIVSGLGYGASQTVLLAEGAFNLSGLGYLASQTVLLDEVTGQHRTRWASAGRLAVAGKNIRIIEQGASNSNRLGRLLPDGTVLRGDRLQGFHTDDHCVFADGTLLFVREGHLLMARDLFVDFDMPVPPPDRRDGTIVCRLAVGHEHVFVTYAQQRGDQSYTYGVVAGDVLP